MRQSILRTLLLTACVALCAEAVHAQARRPNVLLIMLIMADDLNDDMGVYGLYSEAADAAESANLADDPRHRDVVAQMQKLLRRVTPR